MATPLNRESTGDEEFVLRYSKTRGILATGVLGGFCCALAVFGLCASFAGARGLLVSNERLSRNRANLCIAQEE